MSIGFRRALRGAARHHRIASGVHRRRLRQGLRRDLRRHDRNRHHAREDRGRTREAGKWVEKANDLYEALSIFIQRGAVYRVSAGVTPITGGSDEEWLARAGQQLDHMLGSLEIPAPER